MCPFLAYRKAIDNLDNDKKWQNDTAVGKRIGLYKLSGELGKGNFSQVKTGYHELTKGKVCCRIYYGPWLNKRIKWNTLTILLKMTV